MEGIEANLFFTFFGLDAIIKKRMGTIKVATVGNPAMHMPSVLGVIPGMSAIATKMMKAEMEKLDIPPVSEFIEMIADAGGTCTAARRNIVDMFHLSMTDFCPQVKSIITCRSVLPNVRRGADYFYIRGREVFFAYQ